MSYSDSQRIAANVIELGRAVELCRLSGSLKNRERRVMNDAIRITRTPREGEAKGQGPCLRNRLHRPHVRDGLPGGEGLYDRASSPTVPFPMDPATPCCTTARACSRPSRACSRRDGKIRPLPSPEARRAPEPDGRAHVHSDARSEMVMKSWTTLVDVDRDWTPSSVGRRSTCVDHRRSEPFSACGRPSSISTRHHLAGRPYYRKA